MSETSELVLDETSRDRFGLPTTGVRERLRKLRVRFHPPRRLYPTRAGIFTLGTPIILGVAAVNAGNNLLFILLALSLVLILLSGFLSERNLVGLSVRVESAGRVFAGEPARVVIHLKQPSAQLRPRFGIRLAEARRKKWPRQGTPLDETVGVLDRAEQRSIGHRTFPRRGLKRFRTLELSTHYPFGLFRKVRDVDADAALVVWPRPVAVPASLGRPETLSPEGSAARARGLGLDVYGLREREEWDLEHRVHALRSLVLGRDVVIETEATKRPEAWLGIDNGPGANPEAFERAIELAASTLLAWHEAGYAVGLETASSVHAPNGGGPDRFIDELALLEIEDRHVVPERASIWIVPEGAKGPSPGSGHARVDVDALGEVLGVAR